MSASGEPSLRGWRWAAIAGYAAVIALLTLTSRRGTSGALTPNFVPFASLIDLASGSGVAVVNNVVGNLLLFAPLAVLLRLLVIRSARLTLLTVGAISSCVEVVQGLGLPNGRQANVDDVLLNVVGAAVALALLHLAKRHA